ncbi:methyl-accepting chemotaxis protein [Leeia oryzae]|uniref:methyl-accepting chemotaxis protein n=1 Tax=Leeia oryzae TaxID=356662 RepID=UPI0003623A43|nr:PAS domain-containing methyl-accepting chemotaxis protein [Leeia oryzae]
MRKNLPVTNQETLLPEGEFIYSQTDLQGNIIELNDAFARISGYAREEMLGRPHNMVRHPDMPEQAFEDMWRDLKAGRPWRGLVKNRRKDGGYYWVVANASPVRHEGRVVGYQSVRTSPTRAEVAAAEEAYRRVRAGDRSIRILHGRASRVRGALIKRLTSVEAVALLMGLSGLLLVCTLLAGEATAQPLWRVLSLSLGGLVAVLAGFFVFLALPRLVKEQNLLLAHLEYLLVTGDLTRRIDLDSHTPRGMISRRLDILVSSVRATMQSIINAAQHVGESTQAVAVSVGQISQSATVQTQATVAAAAAIEEVSVAIGEVAGHAGVTRETSLRSGEAARQGAERSGLASQTVQTLAETINESTRQVEALGQQSSEISRITSVIHDIADQTNLLALNAAIEAARAGEAGRGFAVVADEVRKLAERTSLATQEIRQMLSGIHDETARAVTGMQDGVAHVDSSVTSVLEAKEALDVINAEMRHTAQLVDEIFHSTVEQQNAMVELSGNVSQMAEVTEQNMEVVGHAEMLASRLHGTVDRMLKSVGQYQV